MSVSHSIEESAEDGPMHVLDLPQLYSKPSAASFLSALSQLALKLPSWDPNTSEGTSSQSLNPDGVASYLTRIISSPLNWIESDGEKEEIWETASKRLSERSGRLAMPSLSRAFRIPVSDSNDNYCLEILLYEPTLTGDNLGHKTWIASYLLAKRLPLLLPRHFPTPNVSTSFQCPQGLGEIRPNILELGAGTGLVGLAASGMFSADIHLTDLPPILPNLRHNIQLNVSLAEGIGGNVTAGVLDWSEDTTVLNEEKHDIILTADSLYAAEHSGWLVSTMEKYLKRGARSRVFVELPLRPGSTYPSDFKKKMESTRFELLEDGEETGYDDWETSFREGIEVICWWSVWTWAAPGS